MVEWPVLGRLEPVPGRDRDDVARSPVIGRDDAVIAISSVRRSSSSREEFSALWVTVLTLGDFEGARAGEGAGTRVAAGAAGARNMSAPRLPMGSKGPATARDTLM